MAREWVPYGASLPPSSIGVNSQPRVPRWVALPGPYPSPSGRRVQGRMTRPPGGFGRQSEVPWIVTA
jgi:hypothetical protein